jgi:hypothetical protein
MAPDCDPNLTLPAFLAGALSSSPKTGVVQAEHIPPSIRSWLPATKLLSSRRLGSS